MMLKNTTTPNIETLIFDFGNVLLDIDVNLSLRCFEELGIPPIEECEIHPNNSGIFLAMEIGKASADEFVADMRCRAQNPDLDGQKILQAWNALLLPFEWRRFELVRDLKRSYRVILLSNTNEPHHRHFEASFNEQNPWGIRFDELFDRIFYSDELGMRKPDRSIYELVQAELSAAPETLWFVDDNAPNLVEPKALGWGTHHLTGGAQIESLFVANWER